MKELPFVVGVMADLAGKPDKPLPGLKDPKRKFVEIDRDNFNDVLAASAPRIAFQVDSRLAEDSKLNVELNFCVLSATRCLLSVERDRQRLMPRSA